MGIRLITGRQNRGICDKSRTVYREMGAYLRQGQRKLYLIVPEQFTLSAEKALMAENDLKGLFGADVLSFKRLRYRVLSEVGGINRTVLDTHGRQMLLKRSIREVQSELSVYRRSAGRSGFLDNVSGIISEMKQNTITPESLLTLADASESSPLLSEKLRDITKIFNRFEERLGDDRMDEDDQAAFLCAQIPNSDYLKGARIWIDGFHTFSTQDFNIIGALGAQAEEVVLTLTGDGDEYAPDASAFVIPNRTRERLEGIAAEQGISFEVTALVCPEKADSLSALERNLFSYQPKSYAQATSAIEIRQCKNLWDEVEEGARRIIALVRDQGYRFRDIVVLTASLESYGSVIRRVFTQYQIPFFMDDLRQITENSFLEAVITALDALGNNYAFDDLFAYMKTGFSPLAQEEIEVLENYAIEYGIRFGKWEQPLVKGGDNYDLEALEVLRQKVIAPLKTLKDSICGKQNYVEKTKALLHFLEATEVEGQIEMLTEALVEAGEFDAAGIYNQIWNILMDVFDQVVETMGPEPVTLADYIDVLKCGFSTYTVGIIPNHPDAVNITDLIRSRNNEMRALFVFGANEGVLPSEGQSFNLLSEKERSFLRETSGLAFKDNQNFHRAQEELAIYTLFSSPQDYLYCSCAMLGSEGESQRMSPIIRQLFTIFPKLTFTSTLEDRTENECDKVSSAGGTFGSYTAYLREARQQSMSPEKQAIWQTVGEWYAQNPAYHQQYEKVESAKGYTGLKDVLEKSQAEVAYRRGNEGVLLSASVSRLEQYRKCPFAHFVKYGLRPEERQEYAVAMPDIGTVLHSLVDQVFKETKSKGQPLTSLKPEESDAMVDRILEELLPDVRTNLFFSSGSSRYLARKVNRVGKKTVQMLVEHLQKGCFEMTLSEHQFSQKIRLKDLGDVRLRGTIDRIDTYIKEGETFVKIIDYKTGNKSIKLSEIYYGLSLQLLIYMDAGLAILDSAKNVPGGSFYFHIDNPFLDVDKLDTAALTKALNNEFKLEGLFLDDVGFAKAMEGENKGEVYQVTAKNTKLSRDEFDDLLAYARQMVTEMMTSILGGDIAVKPYKMGTDEGCTYCSYNGICQFDTKLAGASYDVLKSSISRKVLMEKIRREEKEDGNDMDDGSAGSH